MIDTWWAQLAERLAAQARANLPGLPDAVQRAMLNVWSEAILGARSEAQSATSERERLLTDELRAMQETAQRSSSALALQRELTARLQEQVDRLETERAAEQRRQVQQETSLSQALTSVVALQRQLHEAHQATTIAATRQEKDLDRAPGRRNCAGFGKWTGPKKSRNRRNGKQKPRTTSLSGSDSAIAPPPSGWKRK